MCFFNLKSFYAKYSEEKKCLTKLRYGSLLYFSFSHHLPINASNHQWNDKYGEGQKNVLFRRTLVAGRGS